MDIVDAALGMPARQAAQLVPVIQTWTGFPYQFRLPHKLGALMVHLAQGGAGQEAVDLAKAVLSIQPSENSPTRHPRGAYVRDWEYCDILRRSIPSMVSSVREPVLEMLCTLLDTAVTAYVSDLDQASDYEDYSSIWLNQLDSSEEHRQDDILSGIVLAVTAVALELSDLSVQSVSDVIHLLESFDRRIFHRIALYVLANDHVNALDLASERLANRLLFDDDGIQREYSLLAKRFFGDLDGTIQDLITGWIDEGPDIESYRSRHEAATGEPRDQQREAHYIKIWTRDRLKKFGDVLSDQRQRQLDELNLELGSTEDYGFSLDTQVITGPNISEISADKLGSMDTEELVAFLQSWEPTSGFMEPDYEDVGNELATVVASDLAKFAMEIDRFRGIRPEFVGGVVSGIHSVANTDEATDLPWEAILGYLHWVVAESSLDSADTINSPNRSWHWARANATKVLIRGFGSTRAQIPFDLRELAWEVLKPLTDDPDPSPGTEDDYSGMGIYGVSINSVRGQAIHAVVHYAMWLARNLRIGAPTENVDFSDMPEVQGVLEAHLDETVDSSRAIRAVYGRFFPWLVLLDSSWSTENIGKIFPSEERFKSLKDAAWETYLLTCPAYNNIFQILNAEYTKAVANVTASPFDGPRSREDPSNALAQHIMTLYMRGDIPLDEGGLILTLFSRARDDVRNHAIAFAGQTVKATEGDRISSIVDRLTGFWIQRLDAAKTGNTPNHLLELSAFGWWFISETFDNNWAIAQLIEVLQITGRVEIDHQVVERLSSLASTLPNEVAEAFKLMIEGDREGWHVDMWKQHLRLGLTRILVSDDDQGQRKATSLIHRLAARGYLDFGDLLVDEQQS